MFIIMLKNSFVISIDYRQKLCFSIIEKIRGNPYHPTETMYQNAEAHLGITSVGPLTQDSGIATPKCQTWTIMSFDMNLILIHISQYYISPTGAYHLGQPEA